MPYNIRSVNLCLDVFGFPGSGIFSNPLMIALDNHNDIAKFLLDHGASWIAGRIGKAADLNVRARSTFYHEI